MAAWLRDLGIWIVCLLVWLSVIFPESAGSKVAKAVWAYQAQMALLNPAEGG